MMNKTTKEKLQEIIGAVDAKYQVDLRSILQRSDDIGHKDVYMYLYLLAEEIFRLNADSDCCYNPDGALCSTDLEKLADNLNIEIICKKELRSASKFKAGFRGYIDTYDLLPGGYTTTIYVNEKSGNLTQRYCIAKGISHCVISWIKYSKILDWCFYELDLIKDTDEEITSILTSFLLLSIENVLEIYSKYKAKHEEAWDMFEFMRKINYNNSISDYHGVICLQDIKYLVNVLYNYHGELQIPLCEEIRSGKYKDLIK